MQGILPASFPACRRTPPTGKRKENWELWFCGYIYIKKFFVLLLPDRKLYNQERNRGWYILTQQKYTNKLYYYK